VITNVPRVEFQSLLVDASIKSPEFNTLTKKMEARYSSYRTRGKNNYDINYEMLTDLSETLSTRIKKL